MLEPTTTLPRTRRGRSPVVLAIGVVCLIAAAVGVTMVVNRQPRIACVRSQSLISGYTGTTEARQTFDSLAKTWQVELDTLKHDYQTAYEQYKIDRQGLSEQDRKKRVEELSWLQNNVQHHLETLTQRSKSEEEKMAQGVMRQVNTMIEKYGRDNNYDVILGTTLSGSVLYAREAIDITDDLLKQLNNSYRPASLTELGR